MDVQVLTALDVWLCSLFSDLLFATVILEVIKLIMTCSKSIYCIANLSSALCTRHDSCYDYVLAGWLVRD
jgi:hypothetical protein